MARAQAAVDLHRLRISPPEGAEPPYDRLSVAVDLIFRFSPGFTADFWLTLYKKDLAKQWFEDPWEPIAEIYMDRMFYRHEYNSRGGEIGFDLNRYKGGIKAKMFPLNNGKRTNLKIDELPIRSLLWPGRHELAVGFYNGLMQRASPAKTWDKPRILAQYETPFLFNELNHEPKLRRDRGKHKAVIDVDLSERDIGDGHHIYSLAETNLGALKYQSTSTLYIEGAPFHYRTRWLLPDFGYIRAGMPMINLIASQSLRKSPVRKVDPVKPWPAIKGVYEELKAVTARSKWILPWSPVMPLRKGIDPRTLEEKWLIPAATTSNSLADTAYEQGIETLRNDELEDTEDYRLSLCGAIYGAFQALRWSPNNIHALACIAGFSCHAKLLDLSLDAFVTLNLKLMLMNRILKGPRGTPEWFAVQQILAWHSHLSVARFSLEPAYIYGMVNEMPLIFDEVQKSLARLRKQEVRQVQINAAPAAPESSSIKKVFDASLGDPGIRTMYSIPRDLPAIVANNDVESYRIAREET